MPVPVVVIGVSGSGKSTVGAALAQRLRVPYADADDLHPEANVAKMRRGEPLDDDDRHPWLEAVGGWLARHPEGGVMACSALRRTYRDQLRSHCDPLDVLLLEGDPEVIAQRQAARTAHFMPASLMASQLATLEPLEPDEGGIAISVDQDVDAIVEEYVDRRGGRWD